MQIYITFLAKKKKRRERKYLGKTAFITCIRLFIICKFKKHWDSQTKQLKC